MTTDNSSLESGPGTPNSRAYEGSFVPLGKAVVAGPLTVVPLEVVEDSRCPIDTQCVWEGRVIVRAEIAAPGGVTTQDLTLGEETRATAYGHRVTLTDVRPDRREGTVIDPGDYRFRFTGR